jgi:ABC-type uncharacterized transport system ATPase subunit
MEPLCNNVAILARGQLKAFGSVESLLTGGSQFMVTAEDVSEDGAKKVAALTERSRMEGQAMTAYFSDQAGALKGAEAISEAGGLVTFLGPQRRSLEEVFIEKVVGEES